MRAEVLTPARVLPFVVFWSTLDRTLALPIVPTIAEEFNTSLALAGTAITSNALAYAVFQLMWGPLSTRWGRVKVLTVSTTIGAGANVLSAAAPEIWTFLIARTVTGGAYAAVFAAVLTYIGDTVPLVKRPGMMSNLASSTALSIALGTLFAGGMAEITSWRWIFAIYGLLAFPIARIIATLPDPGNHHGERVLSQIYSLSRNTWALIIFFLVALEGALLIGVFNFLPVALQESGGGIFVSGLVTASFGVAVIIASQLMKLFVHQVHPAQLLAFAGVFGLAAFGVLLLGVNPHTVLWGSALMGVAWALGHTTIQTWATDAMVDSRALGMTLFSISLMLGGSAGAAAGSWAAEEQTFPLLFVVSGVSMVAFGGGAALWRARYQESGK